MQSERVTQIAWAPNLCYCTRGGGTSEKLESYNRRHSGGAL